MGKYAVLVVDIINDFVTGALGCDRAHLVVEPAQRLLRAARKSGVPVIFCNDAHIKGVDKELELWGDHAIEGTKGAEVIPELELCDKDFIVPKRRYGGFFQTNLDMLLRELGVDTVILTGLHTHLCVRHTGADAYQLGYKIIMAKDATQALTEELYQTGLKYFEEYYGAEIADVDTVVEKYF